MLSLPTNSQIAKLEKDILSTVSSKVIGEMRRQSFLPKTGRKYKKKGYDDHIASSNDSQESYANWTGHLNYNLKYVVRGRTMANLGSDVKYLKYLEEGTKKMNPRPTIEFAFKALDIKNIIKGELDVLFR